MDSITMLVPRTTQALHHDHSSHTLDPSLRRNEQQNGAEAESCMPDGHVQRLQSTPHIGRAIAKLRTPDLHNMRLAQSHLNAQYFGFSSDRWSVFPVPRMPKLPFLSGAHTQPTCTDAQPQAVRQDHQACRGRTIVTADATLSAAHRTALPTKQTKACGRRQQCLTNVGIHKQWHRALSKSTLRRMQDAVYHARLPRCNTHI